MDFILLPWTIATTILLFVAAYWIYAVEKRVKLMETQYRELLALAEQEDDANLLALSQRIDALRGRTESAEAYLQQLRARLPHIIQGYGMLRYQAFSNVGGDQSFSLALVDARGSGAIISCLHGNEIKVYGKPVVQWRSSYSLSAEEQQALGEARRMVGTPIAGS